MRRIVPWCHGEGQVLTTPVSFSLLFSLSTTTFVLQLSSKSLPLPFPRNSQHAQIDLELNKPGPTKRWKKRHVVLRSTRLSYYKDQKEYQVLCLIHLEDITAIAEVKLRRRQNVFGVVTRERSLFFQCDDKAELDSWLFMLRQTWTEVANRSTNQGRTTKLGNLQSQLSATLPGALSLPIPHSIIGASGSTSTSPGRFSPLSRFSPTVYSTVAHISMERNLQSAVSGPISLSMPTSISASQSPKTRLSVSISPPGISQGILPNIYRRSEDTPVSTCSSSPPQQNAYSSDSDFETPEAHAAALELELLRLQVSQDDRTLNQGYLYKLGGLFNRQSWKKRWCTFRNGKLGFYKDDREYQLTKLIPLTSIIDIVEIGQNNKRDFCFKIATATKELVLSSDSDEETRMWVGLIREMHSQVVAGKVEEIGLEEDDGD